MATGGKSARDKILDYVRDARLKSGDPLPTEFQLMELLGVSRNTIREAVRELRTLGILEVRHGRGTYVGNSSLSSLSQALIFRVISSPRGEQREMASLVEMREAIEMAVLSNVVGNLPPEVEARLRELANHMDDPASRESADREFHTTLAASAGNDLVADFVDVFWDAYHAAHDQLQDISAEAAQATRAHHMKIVDTVASGDLALARKAMEEHFDELKRRLA